MTSIEGKVVVIATIETDYIDNMEKWYAVMPKLGITAYGETEDKAKSRTKDMFADKVQVLRRTGHLKEWLDRTGLDWEWEALYQGTLPVEDVSIEEDNDDEPLVVIPTHPNLSWPIQIYANSRAVAA